MTNEPCVFLQWDTDFFGFKVARVNGHNLDVEKIKDIYRWCEDYEIECLYFLAGSDDPKTIRCAEDHNFRLVEVRVNMDSSLKNWDPSVGRYSVPIGSSFWMRTGMMSRTGKWGCCSTERHASSKNI